MDVGIIVTLDDDWPHDSQGYTWLWRKCCLNKVKDAFQMQQHPGSKNIASDYTWCFTKDVGGLTITGRAKSLIRKGGLIYSQFYMMNKLQFDATKRFPWDDKDDTMAWMAVDSNYREALRAIVGAKAMDPESCRTSYNHCGRRFMLGVRTNDSRSWGAREEHRITLALLMMISTELRSRGNPEIRSIDSRRQFYVIETGLVNSFTEHITLPLARWYQEVLGKSKEGMLGEDRQKMAVMLSLMVKLSYSNSLLERYPLIWSKKSNNGAVQSELGLGLKQTIEDYGFGWLKKDMFDWKANNFALNIAEAFPFPIRQVEKHYQAKRKERRSMMDVLREVDHVTGRIELLANSRGNEWSKAFLIWWLATRIIRQYHTDVWVALYESSYEFMGKAKERERQEEEESDHVSSSASSSDDEGRGVPQIKRRKLSGKGAKAVHKSFRDPPRLTYQSIRYELQEKPHPCGRGRQYVDRDDVFDLLFLAHLEKDNDLKQGWKRLPHLHALALANARLKGEEFDELTQRMRDAFERYCLCIPSVSKDRWLAHSSKSKVKPAWIGFGDNGERLERPNYFGSKFNSSWAIDVDIEDEYCWNLSWEEATSQEGLIRGLLALKSYSRKT